MSTSGAWPRPPKQATWQGRGPQQRKERMPVRSSMLTNRAGRCEGCDGRRSTRVPLMGHGHAGSEH
eukprot:1700820-Alexandrium_andersonii.AAC.1